MPQFQVELVNIWNDMSLNVFVFQTLLFDILERVNLRQFQQILEHFITVTYKFLWGIFFTTSSSTNHLFWKYFNATNKW